MLLLCRFGRKFLLIQGGIQLLICEIVVGILIAVGLGTSGETPLHSSNPRVLQSSVGRCGSSACWKSHAHISYQYTTIGVGIHSFTDAVLTCHAGQYCPFEACSISNLHMIVAPASFAVPAGRASSSCSRQLGNVVCMVLTCCVVCVYVQVLAP